MRGSNLAAATFFSVAGFRMYDDGSVRESFVPVSNDQSAGT